MAAPCEIDEASLPLLTGCPGTNEWVVVGNAPGGLDQNGGFTTGYGRRYWSDLFNCILKGLTFVQTILKVGAGLTLGQTVIRVNQTNVIQDSVAVILDTGVLDRNDATRISYDLNYNDPAYPGQPGFTITLNQGATAPQTYVVTYAHS